MSDPHFPPCPTLFNLAQYVLSNAAPSADKIALELLGETGARWSYGALTSAVLGVATGLQNQGLKAGDLVILRLGNTPDFPIAYLGAIAAGMIACPTSAALTVDEITKMSDLIKPKAILQDDTIAAPKTPLSKPINLDELRQMYELPPATWHLGDPNRPAYMVFTSGTSATPRAVIHAHRAIWARRMMHRDWYEMNATDRLLHAGAFNWTYTLGTGLMDPWSLGATALIPEDGTPIEALGALLADNDATIFAAAPGVYRKMLKHKLPKLTRLRHALSAGEKMAQSLHMRWERETETRIYEAFGMSECSTFISSSPSRPTISSALGKPQRGRHVTLRDAAGSEVAKGDIGMIAVHRSDPGLMLGYFTPSAAVEQPLQGAWFLSGDLGREDENGAIHYQGRIDDMINAGGFRVSPLEVEAAFSGVEALAQCAAIEVSLSPDTSVIALCFTAQGEVHETSLQALATDKLARYKRPRIFHQCDTFPLSANGKLLRRVLRSQIEALYGQT